MKICGIIYWPESQVCTGCKHATLVINTDKSSCFACDRFEEWDDLYPSDSEIVPECKEDDPEWTSQDTLKRIEKSLGKG